VKNDRRDVIVHGDVVDPQNHDDVVARGDELLDGALHPHAGAVDEHRTTFGRLRLQAREPVPGLRSRVFAAVSCDSPSTLIPRNGRSFSFGHVVDVFCTQKETSGGSSETGTNVLAARPTRTPSTSAAMAMTPDGKYPNASRNDD